MGFSLAVLVLRWWVWDEGSVVIDGGDVAGVADVHEWIGGEDDEVGGVVGLDEADVEVGVEGVDEASGLSGGDGDGLERG